MQQATRPVSNEAERVTQQTAISPRSEVCSVNYSRPYTDVADWSVRDPQQNSMLHRTSNRPSL